MQEVRNPDSDDSVNSLVDLLKDDDQPKKRGFFGRNKKKNIPKELIVQLILINLASFRKAFEWNLI